MARAGSARRRRAGEGEGRRAASCGRGRGRVSAVALCCDGQKEGGTHAQCRTSAAGGRPGAGRGRRTGGHRQSSRGRRGARWSAVLGQRAGRRGPWGPSCGCSESVGGRGGEREGQCEIEGTNRLGVALGRVGARPPPSLSVVQAALAALLRAHSLSPQALAGPAELVDKNKSSVTKVAPLAASAPSPLSLSLDDAGPGQEEQRRCSRAKLLHSVRNRRLPAPWQPSSTGSRSAPLGPCSPCCSLFGAPRASSASNAALTHADVPNCSRQLLSAAAHDGASCFLGWRPQSTAWLDEAEPRTRCWCQLASRCGMRSKRSSCASSLSGAGAGQTGRRGGRT